MGSLGGFGRGGFPGFRGVSFNGFFKRVSGGFIGLRVEGGFRVWDFGFRVPSLGSFRVPLRVPFRGLL